MANRSPTIIDRADEVDTDLVPEPWDDRDAAEDQEIVTRRERYRLQGATDGQGAGIVPAYNLNVADTEAIPSKTKDGWTRGSAGRVLGPDGKYVSRGSDVPRKSFDGEEPGLLVEAAGRTNQIPKSSQISKANWDGSFGIASETKVDSILEEKNAYKITGAGSSLANVNKKNVGTFTGGTETVEFIIEKGTSGKVGGEVRNSDTGNNVVGFRYDWGTDTLTVASGSAQRMNTRRTAGPNGNPLVFLTVSYSAGNAENTSGDTRRLFANVDASASASNSIWHHAQLEEAPNASSPIVTGSSAKTRAADNYTIFDYSNDPDQDYPEWWNPNEGTIFGAVLFPAYKQPDFVTHLEIAGVAALQTAGGNITFNYGGANFGTLARSYTPFTNIKFALSMKENNTVFSTNGSSQSDTGVDPSGASSMLINEGISRWQKLIYYPRALPESTLNAITS